MQKSDMTKFKGARRIVTDLEHGDYTFLVIAKLPGIIHDTNSLEAKSIEF
jgi:protocatechuate 3,4-dioxygenase beta subunit